MESATEKRLLQRSASLPVQECLTGEWADFCKLLHGCWQQSTALANWAVRQLLAHDPVRMPGETRCGKMQPVYLYGLAKKSYPQWAWWKGAYAQANAVLRGADKRYRALRLAIWRGEAVPPTFRYPYPFPVHPESWSARLEQGQPVVSLALPGGRVEVRLRTEPQFGRQLAVFRRIAAGEAKRCELAILRQGSSKSCHRRTLMDGNAGGQRQHSRIMIRLVTQLEVEEVKGGRTLVLSTDPNALWTAELDGRQAWVLNADHLKRLHDWSESHSVRLQRWSEDAKAERRCSSRKRRQFEASRERACQKHNRRLKSWCQEACAHLARFAARQGVAQVAYQDANKDYMPHFRWHYLKTCLQNALDAQGIELIASEDSHEEGD